MRIFAKRSGNLAGHGSRWLLIFISCITLSCNASREFEFAWLSDTHIGSSGADENLAELVSDINKQAAIEFTILSGDVTELDTDDYLLTAGNLLDQLSQPCYVIPGNHDTKWSASGGRNFIRLFDDDKFTFLHQNIRFIGIHQGPVLRMGDGHFAPQDLRWLDSLLNKTKPHKKLLFVTHYPINPSVSNWVEFLKLIKGHNAKFLIHGHGHRNRSDNYAGLPAAMGRSSLSRGKEAGYNIVQVSDGQIIISEKSPGKPRQKPWFTLSLETETNIELPQDVPDYSTNDQYPQVKVIWRNYNGYTLTAAAAVDSGRVYTGDASGRIYAFDLESGNLLWQYESGAPVYAGPQVRNHSLVFTSTDSNIYCLNNRNGALKWRVKTGAPVIASPITDSLNVYVGSSDGYFRCIDLISGSLLWKSSQIEGYVETRPLLYEDKVIFGAWDGNLYALDRQSGATAWTWSGGRSGVLYSPAACRPVAGRGKIFIVAPDRYMTAINSKTGDTIWRSDRFQVRESIGMAADGSAIYARCMRDTVFAINPAANRLQPEWVSDCSYGYDIAPSMPQERGGTVFFGTKDGYVFALDRYSGDVKWKYRVGPNLVNTVSPLNNHQVVATTINGQIILLSEETE